MIPWILVAIAVLLVVLAVVYFYARKKRPVDYYNLFIIGIIWTGVGIPLKNYALFVIGLILMGIGGFNHDKWKKNKKRWKDLSKKEKKITVLIMILLLLLVLAGFVFLFMAM